MGDECHAASSELQTFLDGECGAALERAIVAHLERCEGCEHRADFERELRVVIATKCRDVAPSGLLERIKIRLAHTS
jgi:mycothiol system anti-sigma-R factor